MKKTLLILILTFALLGGCTSKSEPEPPVQPEVPETKFMKLDESKPFIYTEDVAPLTLKDYLIMVDDWGYDSISSSFKEMYPLLADKESLYVTDRIILNFVSDDAKRIQRNMDDMTNKTLEGLNERNVEGSTNTSWLSYFLYDLVETDEYLSFTAEEVAFAFNSHGFSERNMYVFSKEDGRLLNNDEILKLAGKDQAWLDARIATVVKNNNELESSYAPYYFDKEMAEAYGSAMATYWEKRDEIAASGGDETSVHLEFEGDREGVYFKMQDEHAMSIDKDGKVKIVVLGFKEHGPVSSATGHSSVWILD